MSHRQPCRVRHLHQKLQLLLERRVSQVRLLILQLTTVDTRSEFYTWPGPGVNLGFSLVSRISIFNL
jgi:hypothetical protein